MYDTVWLMRRHSGQGGSDRSWLVHAQPFHDHARLTQAAMCLLSSEVCHACAGHWRRTWCWERAWSQPLAQPDLPASLQQ